MKKGVRLTRFGSTVALMVAFGGFLTAFGVDDAPRIYGLPEEDPRCDLYRVSVDGLEVPVSAATAFRRPAGRSILRQRNWRTLKMPASSVCL